MNNRRRHDDRSFGAKAALKRQRNRMQILRKFSMCSAVLIICALCIGSVNGASSVVRAQILPQAASFDASNELFAAVEVITETPSTATGVEILASGEWRNGCVPIYDNTVIEGYTVEIYAIAEQMELVCGQVISEWSFTTDLNLDAPGLYTVNVYITSEWDDETTLYNSTSVIVDGAIHLAAGSAGSDDISFLVDGFNYDACVPQYESHDVSGNLITIEAEKPGADIVCGQDVTAWSFEVPMGTLDPGDYEVEVYVTSFINTESERLLYRLSTLTVDSSGTRRMGTTQQPAPPTTQQFFMYIPTFIAE